MLEIYPKIYFIYIYINKKEKTQRKRICYEHPVFVTSHYNSSNRPIMVSPIAMIKIQHNHRSKPQGYLQKSPPYEQYQYECRMGPIISFLNELVPAQSVFDC